MNSATVNHLTVLADAVWSCLGRLAEDPEHLALREESSAAVTRLAEAAGDLSCRTDLMLRSLPRCPLGHLTAWAIGGGRVVTSAEIHRWRRDLDAWSNEIERIAKVAA